MPDPPSPLAELSRRGRLLVLAAAFLGWMFAGLEMGTFPQLSQSATTEFFQLDEIDAEPGSPQAKEIAALKGKWFGWHITAFLLGAAAGGLVFGGLGDRIGRVKAMGLSILCYSGVTGLSYFAQTAEQLIALRFVACMGIGGMWPTGVALANEAWPAVSRPMLAGLIGTSANVGLALMGFIAEKFPIIPDNWRWVLLVGAAPLVLGVLVMLLVPESPAWLATRREQPAERRRLPVAEVFRPPLLRLTLIGILLGTIPLLGGWGSGNWTIGWADAEANLKHVDANFKGTTQMYRSIGATIGALCGGWLASMFGRRSTYFAISLLSLLSAGWIFWFLQPGDGYTFLFAVFTLGLISTVFFGWLPLYLPELFPTRARSTGAGVTFNFGRVLTAAGVLSISWLLGVFDGDYAKLGRVTSLIYALGMVVILLAPDTSKYSALDEAEAG